MRAPGNVSGAFALESALDELSYALKIDPLELRLINYAETDPDNGKPFSSKELKECYRQGAERFGWKARKPEPRSMRDGGLLVGWGMATGTWGAGMAPGYGESDPQGGRHRAGRMRCNGYRTRERTRRSR